MSSMKLARRVKTISASAFARQVGDPYMHNYYLMKSQRLVLDSVAEKLHSHADSLPPDIKGPFAQFVVGIDKLLGCSLADVYECAITQLDSLRDFMKDHIHAVPELESTADVCLKALLTLTRRLYAVSYDWDADNSTGHSQPISESESDVGSSVLLQEDTVICRICDEPVRIEDLEEHTASCLATYKNESRIKEIDDALAKLDAKIVSELCHYVWPGELQVVVVKALPLLNVHLLVDRILELNAKSPYAKVECETVMESLANIMRSLDDLEWSLVIGEIKELVHQKKHTTLAMSEDVSVLQRTILTSGNGDMKRGTTSIADFDFIKLISAGAYARVFLARKKITGDIFAIKVLPRNEIMQKNQVNRVFLEKDLLLKLNNPYIINFYYSLAGRNNFYIVMEYLPGGDLFSMLSNLGGLPEDTTKIYAYEIACALQYLHSLGIIHRDLKPDNVLISATGTLKLTDFGLSYQGFLGREASSDDETIVKSKSVVGTPDYIPPEIVMRKSHTFTVDWWALGVIIYEFIMGEAPFHASSEMEIYTNIVKGTYCLPDPEEDEVSPECIDIISRLLDPNPETRLGARGSDEVLNHPWFSGMKGSEIVPPFVPELANSEDTNYFACRYKFKRDTEADIVEDIKHAESVKAEPLSVASRSRSLQNLAGEASKSDDEGSSFSAVSITKLASSNRDALLRAVGSVDHFETIVSQPAFERVRRKLGRDRRKTVRAAVAADDFALHRKVIE